MRFFGDFFVENGVKQKAQEPKEVSSEIPQTSIPTDKRDFANWRAKLAQKVPVRNQVELPKAA